MNAEEMLGTFPPDRKDWTKEQEDEYTAFWHKSDQLALLRIELTKRDPLAFAEDQMEASNYRNKIMYKASQGNEQLAGYAAWVDGTHDVYLAAKAEIEAGGTVDLAKIAWPSQG